MADQVLYSGVACITDLMVKEGLINLDFADVRSVMRNMGKAMMGTGEATGDGRALQAAEAAISNPLLDETSMKGARGLLVSVVGGKDLTLFEVDEATTRIREEVDDDANIIFGATFDDSMDGVMRVSVVATGIDHDPAGLEHEPRDSRVVSFASRTAKKDAPAASAPAATASQDPAEAAVAAVAAGLEEEFAASLEPLEEAEVYDDEALVAAVDHVEDEAPRLAAADLGAPAPRGSRTRAPDHDYDVHEGDDRRPMGLLRRIASGLSRRDEEEEDFDVEPRASRRRPAPSQARLPAPERRRLPAPDADAYMDEVADGVPRPARSRPQPPAAAPRRPRIDAEPASRARPAPRPSDDDQLEIPAFLRRQAN